MQADTLFLRDPPGRWIYQLTVCDPASKLIAAERHHPFGAQHTGASKRILKTFPVEIRGSRPTTAPRVPWRLRELLQERDIAMQVIQPCSPKQNGCVGRCQRTGRRKLYETSSVAATLDEYSQDARRFVVHHNHIRPHAAPGGRTPIEDLPEHPGESLRRNLTATDSGENTTAGRACQECPME